MKRKLRLNSEQDTQRPRRDSERMVQKEEISRQRRLLGISRKPDTSSHVTDLPQQHDCEEEEGLDEQQVCNQERNSSLDQEDPEPPQIKEEQEELCSSQGGEQLGLKQEADPFTVTSNYEQSDHSESQPNSEQLFSHSAPEAKHDQEESQHVDSGSTRNAEQKKRRHHRTRSHSQRGGNTSVSESQSQTGTRKKSLQCDTCGKTFHYKSNFTKHLSVHTDLPQKHDCEEEEGLDEQQVCNQEDPEPPQIKEEQEELCSSQEGEQLGLKQEAEGIIVWTDEERLRLLETIWKPEIKLHRIDLKQQHVCDEEEQQVCNQERNSSVNQEDPEPPQIKVEQEDPDLLQIKVEQEDPEPPHIKVEQEDPDLLQIKVEQEELYCSQEEEQFGLKQEADTFMVTYEESDHSELEPNSEQLLSLEESQHVDSGSTRNADRRHHRKRTHSQRVGDTPVSQSQTDTRKKCLQCDTCGKTFHRKSNLTTHLRVHTGEKPYSCSICGKEFSLNSTLKTHLKLHNGEKPYSCSSCGKSFIQKSDLERHVRIHTGEKPYSCSTCGKEFTLNSTLKTHTRLHTGEKPYSCSICGKQFTEKSALKTHVRIHTGEKPRCCTICGKNFTDLSVFIRHNRVHTGEKPYSCTICGKRFSQRGNLKTHMRVHTG